MRRPFAVGPALGLAAIAAGCAAGPALETRATVEGPVGFEARALIAVSDLDMAATGYADGRLRQLAGRRDALTVLTATASGRPAQASAAVSNSVVGWPGPIALSPDGRFAYVVETQAEIDDAVERVDNPYGAAPGRRLTAVDLSDPADPRVIATVDVCGDPASVDVHPSGAYAIVACRDDARPLTLVTLRDGAPVDPRPLPIAIPAELRRDGEPGISFSKLGPDGDVIALNVANQAIVFADVAPAQGAPPREARVIGAPATIEDGWLAMVRWSPDGRHYLAADVGWGPGALDAVLNGPGRILSIAFDPRAGGRIVSEARVSLSPESFDLDPSGSLLAVVNMERTYLPEGLPFSLFGRRTRSSISLVSFDAATGGLRTVDGPVAWGGVLPEDVVFDNTGRVIAAVSYQDRSPNPQAGWVELFRIDRGPAGPRIEVTGVRWPLPRGAHDLAVVR